MLYSLFRPLLFALDAEAAHEATLAALDIAATLGATPLLAPAARGAPVSVMGLEFTNRVGLAAGLDKNARYIDGLAALGFGFIECGTVTPRPQSGNSKPRLFRITPAGALINRLGFNNHGLARFLENVATTRYRGILGLNIGRNFDTPNERAADDYLMCFRAVYAHASYVTVNVSSPNTAGLRELQDAAPLQALVAALKAEQDKLAQQHGKYTPLVIKIAPDLTPEALHEIAALLMAQRVDGVIATNTTLSRVAVHGLRHADQSGGLSGRPLREQSTEVIRTLAAALDGALPIIGVGGIMSAPDAREKIDAGASLVQLYTGLIYRGPELVAECVKALG